MTEVVREGDVEAVEASTKRVRDIRACIAGRETLVDLDLDAPIAQEPEQRQQWQTTD